MLKLHKHLLKIHSHHNLHCQGLIQAVFSTDLPILGTLIWARSNSVLNKIITTSKWNSSFFDDTINRI